MSYRGVYREGVYREGVSEEQTGRDIEFEILYPYYFKADNIFSNGAIRITDTNPPFNEGPVSMIILEAEHQGNTRPLSTDIIPMSKLRDNLRILIGSEVYTIVVKDEPYSCGNNRFYYTYAVNGITPLADTLITSFVVDNKYITNLINIELLYTNTGDIVYYSFFAMLHLLEKQYDRADHYIRSNGADTKLLDDYMNKKQLFFHTGPAPDHHKSKSGVWRLLSESEIGKNLLGNSEASRENIIEFIVKKVYTPLAKEWAILAKEV